VENSLRPDVVLVCQLFYPEMISTGQIVTELAEELAARGAGISVIAAQPTVVAGAARVPVRLYHRGISIHRTWSTRLPKTSFVGKLLNLTTYFASAAWEVFWRYRHSQLLLLTNPPYLPLLGWFMNLLRGQRFGVLVHDIMPEQAELIGFIKTDGWLARMWRWFNRLWYRRAAYVVVLTRDMREGMLRNANSSEDPAARAKTHVIHIWSDDRLINPEHKSASKEAVRLGVQDRFVVQYSGNHGRFHDIETVLGIALSFGPEEGLTFQFIGEGQKKRLVNERLAAGAHPHLYSSGYVPKELLADSLTMADLGVVAQLPGQERVCYPSKFLGIMAAGRAVLAICPPDCEMARMIREHELGFVVSNGDVSEGRRVLLAAKADPERVRRMGENAARLLREKFTLAKAAEAYYSLLNVEHTE
jgi:glycosyltransferase involved in cell wall biosynthesis